MQKQVNNDNTGKKSNKKYKNTKINIKIPQIIHNPEKSDKTNLKNLIINIKGYKAIKTNKLLDKQYYLQKTPMWKHQEKIPYFTTLPRI